MVRAILYCEQTFKINSLACVFFTIITWRISCFCINWSPVLHVCFFCNWSAIKKIHLIKKAEMHASFQCYQQMALCAHSNNCDSLQDLYDFGSSILSRKWKSCNSKVSALWIWKTRYKNPENPLLNYLCCFNSFCMSHLTTGKKWQVDIKQCNIQPSPMLMHEKPFLACKDGFLRLLIHGELLLNTLWCFNFPVLQVCDQNKF